MYQLPIHYDKEIIPKQDPALGYLYFMDVEHPLASKYGKVYMHRHVMSIKLGRWVLSSEIVHHKDSIRNNNLPSNLEVLSNVEHRLLHCIEWGLNVKSERTCPNCGTRFISLNGKYCSQKCGASYNSKLKNIDKEQLETLVWAMPTVDVAEMFDVSDTAIAKRCKRLGVNKPPRGYWEKKYHGKL